jgi:predicted  nucleic acid-binding Zn-ribbon protein
VLTQTTDEIAAQVQSAQSVIDQNQGDINSYLSNLGSLDISIDAGNTPLLFNVFANGKQALDGFIEKIKQLAESFISKTTEQIVNDIKAKVEEQVQKVIDDQTNQVLSNLGLSGFDKNTLLLLPCIGYVVPGAAELSSALGVDGAISNFTNSKLVDNINSGIDSAISIIDTANDQLSQVSQSITSVQNTITSFTSQITQLEKTADELIKNADDTAMAQVDQAVSTVQSTGSQNIDTMLKVPSQTQSGSQVCEGTTCTSSIADQQLSQQQIQAQNLTNILQSKTNLLNLKTRLETVETTLQNTIEQQRDKLNQTQQAQIQKQIQAIQDTIGQVDTWVTKIDTYKNQMDEINSKISSAQQSLTSISDSLSDVQNFINNNSDKISGWIAKLIPSGFRAYGVLPNTTYKDQQFTEAVQIQVKWQDDPPDSKYINGEKDNKGILNALIFDIVYRPEAQRKVHNIIAESLQFPYDKNDPNQYRVTQLITFSQKRDVTSFSTILDKLYDASRPANYGLFSMPESWSHIHIAY